MTDEDELLDSLGRRARERWSEASASLRPESVEGWTPLREDERDAIEEGVLARLAAAEPSDRSSCEPTLGDGDARDTVGPAANEPPARRWWVAGGVVAALAAALLLWSRLGPAVAPLPGYEDVGFEGGTAEVRSDALSGDGLPQLRADGELRWRLQPRTAVDGPVEVFISARGSQSRCLAVEHGVRVLPSGAIEVAARIGDLLDLPPGEWALTMIVARPSALEGLADPCAWHRDGRVAPVGMAAVGPRRVRIIDAPP